MEGVKEVSAEREEVQQENLALKAELDSLKQELSQIKSMLSSNTSSYSKTKAYEFPTDSPSKTSSFPMFSIGNEGVPTDRQTDSRQTLPALEVITALKSELKIKFRNLTNQEFKVFSAIYIFEQEVPVDYSLLAERLHLSESSIRDYIMKMERKGIPIHKEKINNKKVLLHVRQELRELVPLEAIMKVREPMFGNRN